jgi:hypothetical protein
VPLIALLVVPVLACFAGGVMAAAMRATPALHPAGTDNIIPFDPARRRA